MMEKQRKARLCALSSIFRLQAGVFLQTRRAGSILPLTALKGLENRLGFLRPFALSEAKYPPAEWIRLMGPAPDMNKSETDNADVRRTIVLASGGTGGHLFPAQALASALEARDWKVHLFTDKRGLEWQDRFREGTVQEIASSTLTFGKPWLLPGQASELITGFRQCLDQFKSLTPQVVVGFGGYPSLPVMMAARYAGISSMLHEQNAVAGRANRIAAGLGNARIIASSFEPLYGFSGSQMQRVRLTGNPVRKQVIDAARPYVAPAADAPFNLLVFGGSQGAQFFSDFMPK